MSARGSGAPRLPSLWRGRRRWLLAGLALAGLGQALASVVTAVFTPRLLSSTSTGMRWQLALLLVGTAIALGALRVAERVMGERLGQSYVHEIRQHLVRHALVAPRGPSLGITVARATNDLTSVRNWVVQGVVPLLVGAQMLVGAMVALALVSPLLALAAGVPVLALFVTLVVLAPILQRRTAKLRRQRGRLAGVLADTVQAGDGIVAAGGLEREVRAVREQSSRLSDLAVSRAVVGGALRGAAATTATVAMVLVGTVGALRGVGVAEIATAFVVVGMMSTPVTDLGRVGEYRQSYLVAQRVIAPLVEASRRQRRLDRELERHQSREVPLAIPVGDVHLAGLEVLGRPVPELVAHPGEVVVPRSSRPGAVDALVAALAHPERQRDAWLQVSGHDLAQLPPAQRRRLVGVADPAIPLERGTIARAVRYRVPESKVPAGPWLDEVGLTSVVDGLERGERTVLRRGGQPLGAPELARLQLARAWYGEPPLVVLHHVDRALDAAGRSVLADALPRRRGVTLLVSDHAAQIAADHRVWDLDAPVHHVQLPKVMS